MQGKLDDARKNYEKAATLGDPDGLAKNSLGELPKPGGSAEAPIADDELITDPVEGLNRRGEAFSHFGMFKRAVAIYSQVLKMNPNHLPAMLNAAAAYYKSGETNRAISLLEKILISYPTHKDIEAHRLLLGQAYAKNGDLNSALKNLEALIKMNPNMKKSIESDPVFEKLRATDEYGKLFP
jgi:tetratricopeptide (TPR) repeat protein